MMWIFFISALLVCGNAQGQGYDYNKPDKQFAPGPSSGFPGSSAPTNGYPSAQQSSGNGFPSTRPIGFEQTSLQQPGPQIPSSQGTGPSRQYPNQPQLPSGQSPGFPGFPSQQPQFPETRPFSPQTDKSNVEYSGGSSDGQYRDDQEDGDYSAIPGEPDIDYPIYSYIPETSFKCEDQQYPGYYADVEARCQVFHICANNKMYDFLCPNGTVFHQEYLVCVWWNQFDCNSAPSLYGINANIYDYSKQGFNYPSGPGQNREAGGYPGSSQNFVDSRPQGESFTGPQTYPQPQVPELSKTQESGPNQRRPSSDRGYPQGPALQPQAPGYQQNSVFNGPGPGYPPQQFATQPQKSSFDRQPTGSGFTPSQPQGFTGYPGPASQTPSYSDTEVGGYPGSQTPSTFTKPTTPGGSTTGSSYPSTSYPKPQTPSPGFGSTEFVGSQNEQTNGYPASGQPFFGSNDVQQQRQYLPPVNG
ncbi:hypothetical protein FQR65_LT11352 [Abscondita terminalis]|nr:hypothetical protein FQR65_LT11352 [Abscondita terminalis]